MILLILLAALEYQSNDEPQLLLEVEYIVSLDIFHNVVHDIQVDKLALLPTSNEIFDDVGDLPSCQRVIMLGEVADLLCSIPIEIIE